MELVGWRMIVSSKYSALEWFFFFWGFCDSNEPCLCLSFRIVVYNAYLHMYGVVSGLFGENELWFEASLKILWNIKNVIKYHYGSIKRIFFVRNWFCYFFFLNFSFLNWRNNFFFLFHNDEVWIGLVNTSLIKKKNFKVDSLEDFNLTRPTYSTSKSLKLY